MSFLCSNIGFTIERIPCSGQTTCKWFSWIYPVSNEEGRFSSITEFVEYGRYQLIKLHMGLHVTTAGHRFKSAEMRKQSWMRAPIQLQCIFSYTILANSEMEPHAPNTYQPKLVPSDSVISNECKGSVSRP